MAGSRIDVIGSVLAPGGGGCECGGWGGSGGGSGGAILQEAPAIGIDGVLAVNGGGGGADIYDDNFGKASDAPVGSSRCGGQGAAGSEPAQAGVNSNDPDCDTAGGGGGGGGVGWLRFNTADGSSELGPNAVLSPSEATGCASMGTLNML